MDVTEYAIKHIIYSSWNWNQINNNQRPKKQKLDIFLPLRKWLNKIKINDPKLAHRLCKMIPSQCPFARTIQIKGRTLLKIPPLCKLNPLYEDLMTLRFRALCYLADECAEDVSKYC